MSVQATEKIYEGKAKALYRTNDERIVQRFKDSATAFNGVKYAEIEGKGEINNRISTTVFRYLADQGIASHYAETLNTRDMLVESVEIVPLEVVARNVAAGSLAKRVGWEEGTVLPAPIVEFYYKKDELGDPLLTRPHIAMLGVASEEELAEIEAHALRVNAALQRFWAACGLTLVDFKLEYGRRDGRIVLADEVSPDTSRLWDSESSARMDKDVFRRDLADMGDTYREVLRRVADAHSAFAPGELAPAPAAS